MPPSSRSCASWRYLHRALRGDGGVHLPKAHLTVGHGAGWGVMTVPGADHLPGGLGWTENGNDYSRYLPPGTSPRRIVAAVALGAAIPSALLEILGAAVATGVPGATSVTGLTAGFPDWFIVPYLAVAIIQLFAINTLDLDPSGVTLQSLVPGLSRLQCVTIDTVVAGGLTAAAVLLLAVLRPAVRLRPVHHRLAGPMVRDLPDRLAAAPRPVRSGWVAGHPRRAVLPAGRRALARHHRPGRRDGRGRALAQRRHTHQSGCPLSGRSF